MAFENDFRPLVRPASRGDRIELDWELGAVLQYRRTEKREREMKQRTKQHENVTTRKTQTKEKEKEKTNQGLVWWGMK